MTVTPSVGTQVGEKPQVSRMNVDDPLAVVAMMRQTVLREEGVHHEVRRTSFGDGSPNEFCVGWGVGQISLHPVQIRPQAGRHHVTNRVTDVVRKGRVVFDARRQRVCLHVDHVREGPVEIVDCKAVDADVVDVPVEPRSDDSRPLSFHAFEPKERVRAGGDRGTARSGRGRGQRDRHIKRLEVVHEVHHRRTRKWPSRSFQRCWKLTDKKTAGHTIPARAPRATVLFTLGTNAWSFKCWVDFMVGTAQVPTATP
mmetsp:Transcript_43477/g.114684  ORF Transcript_43477/g.114684 Transcript_43477/m.114684 type:complete len:255 (+) Transcript_43477:555-1319(+)